MRKLLGLAVLAGGLVLLSVPGSAMPIAPLAPASSDAAVIQVRGGHGGGHGHHFGWGRGRGHHYGWSRGRHRGWHH